MTEQYDHPGASDGRGSPRARDSADGNRTPEAGRFDLDDLFRVLADRRRRFALYHLRRTDGTVRLPTLVSAVLEWETGGDPGTVPERRRQRAYLEFYHNHVPMLAEYGLASYDEDDGVVSLETDLGDAAVLVELARARDGIPPGDPDAEERERNSTA